MHLYYNLVLGFDLNCVAYVGDVEARALVRVESSVKYHPVQFGALTSIHHLGQEQCQAGSLTGAVAS